MLNTPIQSTARQPRGIVMVTGHNKDDSLMAPFRLNGWESWEVNNNIFYEADTFRVTIALSALPNAYTDFALAGNAAWWSSQKEIFVEIFGGFPNDADTYSPNDLQSLTYGRVDDISFDPVARTLEISGRDLTAALIDSKTTEKFQNLTASQIATNIAVRHGLTPVVTKTKIKAGTYYQLDQNKLNDARSEWDLVTGLAQQEQFNVYIKGRSLHFEPQALPNVEPYVLRWTPPDVDNGVFSLNAVSMSFTRALNLARGVVVIIQSISPKTAKAFSVKFPNKAVTIKPGQSAPVAQIHTYRFASMLYETALQKAQQIHKDISQHEVKLSASLPADNILTTANLVQVVGTNTSFDQSYYPESITRSMSMSEGYMMQISAKNSSPQSVVPL